MENMMRKQQNFIANTRSSHALYLHNNSKTIAKLKPKVRIIHIFPPKIIKTDVGNFRNLVQRLTGKPVVDQINTKRVIIPTRPRRVELRDTRFSEFRERIKGEEDIWGDGISKNNAGFLGDFADLDDFMQELNHFQMCPRESRDANSSNMSSGHEENKFV